jgi:hypothetical protein
MPERQCEGNLPQIQGLCTVFILRNQPLFICLTFFKQIVTAMGKMGEGIALLERALHLDPSSKIVQQDLMRLQAKQKLEVQKEKSLYKKMFNLNSTPAPTTSQGKPKVKLTVS